MENKMKQKQQQPVKMSIRLPREIHKILSYAVVDEKIESINQEVVDLLTKKWMREGDPL